VSDLDDDRTVQRVGEQDGVWDERTNKERAAHDGKHYLVTLQYNCSGESPRDAAEQFREYLATTKHPTVTVHPLPYPVGGFVEVEL
jgi:hypothetical protein